MNVLRNTVQTDDVPINHTTLNNALNRTLNNNQEEAEDVNNDQVEIADEHLHLAMTNSGHWQAKDVILSLVKDITIKDLFPFMKFPTERNMSVGGTAFRLLQKKLKQLISGPDLTEQWAQVTKCIKSIMSQQWSNISLQFGHKLKGKHTLKTSVMNTTNH